MNFLLKAIGINAIFLYITILLKSKIEAKVIDSKKRQLLFDALEAVMVFLKALFANPEQAGIFSEEAQISLNKLQNVKN